MKISQKIFTLVAAGTLFAGTLFAEPFSQQLTLGFSSEIPGVVHFDCEALNASEIGKIIQEKSAENQPKLDGENAEALAKFLQQNSKKVTSVTIGFSSAQLGLDLPDEAIIYMRGNVNLEEIVKQFKAAGKEIKSVPVGKKTWYVADADADSPNPPAEHSFVCANQIDKKTIALTVGKNEKSARAAMSKLLKNRKAKTTAKIDFKTPKSALALLRVNGKSAGTESAGTQMPAGTEPERIFATLAETAGTLKLSADLAFPSEEMAQTSQMQIAQLAQFAPMLVMANPALASQPNAAQIGQQIGAGTKVSQDGKTVKIALELPVDVVKLLATAAPAAMPAADDDVFGE